MYDFTTLRPRRDMGAEKWLGLERSGCADPNLAPLSVADMEATYFLEGKQGPNI